jgi:hypothetical protein
MGDIMSETMDELKAIREIVNDVMARLGELEIREDPDCEDPGPVPEPRIELEEGPFADGLNALGTVARHLGDIDVSIAKINRRFTRSDVYNLMASVIMGAFIRGEGWIAGSERSWRHTAEAFRTRASELLGDAMTTEVPVFENKMHPELGLAQGVCSVMDIVLRRLVGQYNNQESDRDLGPNGEYLTSGECVRLAYVVLDAATDTGVVPDDADSVFMKVRKEVYDQYTEMGEGVFGSWSHPGGPVPWSWGGQ